MFGNQFKLFKNSLEGSVSEIEDYISYYNNQRIKLNLNGMSPTEYRAHYYKSN
ncbi:MULTISPECIES: IS3 family transposase [Sphingobacterium]|uniref:IS3 family transposase n=1 Tax=Sphingobacterium TaxID=28453 RepID=UPI000E87C347|nr:hypothetical protein [Sphingobacterium sp.]